jgi:ankyrin repeat protein
MRDREDIVMFLIQDRRVDPSIFGNNALMLAVRQGNYQIVEILLADERVDPSANNNFALKRALSDQNYEIVRMLVDYGTFILNILVDHTGAGREVDQAIVE